NWQQEEPTDCGGERQLSVDGTSRVSREAQARICERLGVRFPGATRRVPRAQQTAERLRRGATVQLMRGGPSEPACRSRFKTPVGGFHLISATMDAGAG